MIMNNFGFNNNHIIQLHGTAMGTRMAPVYANLFMDDLEKKLLAQFPQNLTYGVGTLMTFLWFGPMD